MKLLVISDTHGNFAHAMKAHTLTENADVTVHLGDGTSDVELMRVSLNSDVINVAGNCDYGSNAPRELLWECEGKRILLTHGDIYRVKFGLEKLKQRALEIRADLVLFGHSHIATIEHYQTIMFLNPGTMISNSENKSYAIVNVTPEGITATLHTLN